MTQVDRDAENGDGLLGASNGQTAASSPARPRWRRWIVLGAVAGAVTLLVVTSIEWGPHPLRADFDLPETWSASANGYPFDLPEGSLPSVTLKDDGTADAENLPTGAPGETEDGFECFTPGDTFTGPATWEATSGGLVRILTDEITILWADSGYMGSLDWAALRLAECGADELVTLNGRYPRDLP